MTICPPRGCAAVLFVLLGACAGKAPLADPPGAATADWSRARTVDVLLDEYHIWPHRIDLVAGRPVLLRVTYRGFLPHDFTASDFFAAAATRPGDLAGAALRGAGGTLDVPAGEWREVPLVPLAAGVYPLDCDKPLHEMFGMTGEIVVTPPG